MPNHITNELIAPAHILDQVAGDGTAIDFSKIIPMRPDILTELGSGARPDIEEQAKSIMGFPLRGFEMLMLDRAKSPKDMSEGDFSLLIRYMQALRYTGYANWYDWSIAKWGTKWDAYETKREADDKITF